MDPERPRMGPIQFVGGRSGFVGNSVSRSPVRGRLEEDPKVLMGGFAFIF